ncbi:MAG: O-antigen ligase family protein [Candidatus Krumholzibacteria bacterium]|nr:O-antigen ligase family protein [Candidatus Krumholzibacteria bacterium]
MKSREYTPVEAVEKRRRTGRDVSVSKVWKSLYIAVIGGLAGWQILFPNKRFIETIVGLIVVGIVWNFSALQALWLILVAYPFQFGISIGNSTFIFTIIIFIIYMVRVSTGHYRFRGDKLLSLPIAFLVAAYIISFYNQVNEPGLMRFARLHTMNFFAVLLLYYMLVNAIDDEAKLTKTVGFVMVSAALITFFAFLELLFPGRVILPNLIFSTHKITLVMKEMRVEGAFHDYELLAEFFAVNVPIIILMVVRSSRLLTRVMYSVLLVSVLFMQFSTITRGAFVSLMIGIVYLAWTCRRDLNIVLFTGLAAVFAGMLVLIDAIMARYTVSGSLFDRLLQTTIKRGFIPDSRVISWTGGVERWLRHPFIGNGPGWDFASKLEKGLWPHNSYLYYLDTIGAFGFLAFLLVLYRLVTASGTEGRRSLAGAPFPRALMKVLHVSLIILIIDMVKIDYQRNDIYIYFVWILFALIAVTRNVIDRSDAVETARSSDSKG